MNLQFLIGKDGYWEFFLRKKKSDFWMVASYKSGLIFEAFCKFSEILYFS